MPNALGFLVALVLAAFADTFFVTGYIFYGGLVATAATSALIAGVDPLLVGIGCVIGCVAGELCNIFASKSSGQWRKRLSARVDEVKKRQLGSGEVQAKTNRFFQYLKQIMFFIVVPVQHREGERFPVTVAKVTGRRFLATSRPLNAHFVVQQNDMLRSIFALVIATIVWVTFWLFIFDHVANFISKLISCSSVVC